MRSSTNWSHSERVGIDADAVAREVVLPGTPGFEAVVAAFGPGVVASDGGLDRGRLAAVVFADAAELRPARGDHPPAGEG